VATGAKVNLTEGKVSSHVLRMLGPFSIAIIALISTGIVDTIYLGRLTDAARPNLGVMALAAVGFAFPLTFLGNSANIGLGAGTMSAMSRALGQGDTEKARRHGAAAILMGLMVMAILVSLMVFALPHVLSAMGAEGEIKSMATQYALISFPGLVIVSVAMMSNNILRAGGEAALPSSIMILGAFINIILDPFLIFGWGPFPRMEVQGAALATLIGNTIAAGFGFSIVLFHRKAISFAEMTIGSIKRAWKVIGSVGVPAAGTNIIVPLAATIAVTIVARSLTTVDVAAFTVASRAELISVGMLYALSACIGAITGQNGGAGLTDRVRDTFKFCYWICIVWSTLMAVILALFAPQIAGVFSNDAEVVAKTIPYFYIVPVTIFAYGFVFISAAGFNALGRPGYGLVYTIIRSLLLYVAFIYIGVQMDGLRGAFFGMAGANIISGLIAAILVSRDVKVQVLSPAPLTTNNDRLSEAKTVVSLFVPVTR